MVAGEGVLVCCCGRGHTARLLRGWWFGISVKKGRVCGKLGSGACKVEEGDERL